MNNKEMEAALKVLDILNFKTTEDNVRTFCKCDYLTINKGRDGKDYAWYFDGDGCEAAVSVDTLTELNKDEIEDILA